MEKIRQTENMKVGGRERVTYFRWTGLKDPFEEVTFNLRTNEGEGASQERGWEKREQQYRFWYVLGICKPGWQSLASN